jgi:hypothetical protein
MLGFGLNQARVNLWHASFLKGLLATVPCLLLITACSVGADADRMVSSRDETALVFPDQWQQNLCVRSVEGGEQPNFSSPIGVIDNETLRKAFRQSLEQRHLLGQPESCKYHIDVNLLGVSQPGQGIIVTDPQSISHINYKIFDRDQNPVFLDTVSASYTTKPFDSFFAGARVLHSVEGSVRANFDQFLQHLQTAPHATR